MYDYYLETGEVPGDYVGEIDEIEYSPEGTGEQVPLGEYIEQDAADLVVGMVEATGDAYVEFGGGHFRAFTSGPWEGQVRYSPALGEGVRRTARNALLGNSGRAAQSRVAWARRGGVVVIAVGAGLEWADNWSYYDHIENRFVRGTATAGRTGFSTAGAVGAGLTGAKAGVAASPICGPAAWACAPVFAGVGGFLGGIAGSGGAEWLWDNTLGRLFD